MRADGSESHINWAGSYTDCLREMAFMAELAGYLTANP